MTARAATTRLLPGDQLGDPTTVRRYRLLILPTAVAVAGALVAGCGGGSSPGVANDTGSTTAPTPATASPSSGGSPTQAQRLQLRQFAQCMRAHGVSNFPDPNVAPGAFKGAFRDPSRALRAAATACAHLLPAGSTHSPTHTQAQIDALLAFARCMRSHGFPSFPDPTATGDLTHEMLAAARIDVHQAAVVEAADTCTSVTDGVITKAIVARFVAGH
jgi:hypothetical protein